MMSIVQFTFLYFIAILSLSQAANLVRLAYAPADIIGFWRLLAASLILLPLAITKGDLFEVRKNKAGLRSSLLSGLFLFLHLYTYFFAVQNTKIANAMIIFATNPLFAAGGAWLFFKEKFTGRLMLAYLLAFSGVYYLVSKNIEIDSSSIWGNMSALLSALLYAIYVLFGKKARQSVPNLSYSFTIYFLASMLFGLSALYTQRNFIDWPLQTWLAIAGTVLIPTLLGHFLFGFLLRHLNVNLMTCGKLIEPVLSSIGAFFLFHEDLKSHTLVAFALTSFSVLILFFPWQIFSKKLTDV